MTLVLWHTDSSVCSQKARIALAEVGAVWEAYVPDMANLEQHTPAYRKVSPDGVVPVLIDDGLVVRESSLIVVYLDETRNRARLMPGDSRAKVAARLWLIRCLAIHAAINPVTFATQIREMDFKRTAEERERRWSALPDPSVGAKRRDLFENGTASVHVAGALAELNRTLDLMDAAIAAQGWLAGEAYCVADLSLTSYFDRLDRLGLGAMIRARPAVTRWLERVRARPSYETAISSRIGQLPAGDDLHALEAQWNGVAGAA